MLGRVRVRDARRWALSVLPVVAEVCDEGAHTPQQAGDALNARGHPYAARRHVVGDTGLAPAAAGSGERVRGRVRDLPAPHPVEQPGIGGRAALTGRLWWTMVADPLPAQRKASWTPFLDITAEQALEPRRRLQWPLEPPCWPS